jgi:uncharacterized protein (DUF2236 family)
MSGRSNAIEDIRRAIQDHVRDLVGSSSGGPRVPRRDTGLFGPRSVAWRVHRDFSTMMIGGVAALLLQMLHPAALAGVREHSDFRGDMKGRLKRTARFVSITTYGSSEQARGQIERVRTIHERVRGSLPDGTPYSATDPDLLTFVHVAEVTSFLDAYLRYWNPFLPPDDQDRYFAETAVVARALGATGVPETRRAAKAFLEAVRPELRCDARTREVSSALLDSPESGAAGAFQSIMLGAGIDLLPDWAARLHGFPVPTVRKPLVRVGAMGAATVLRWALR